MHCSRCRSGDRHPQSSYEPNGVNNFVIRGITFEYDNSCTQQGLRTHQCDQCLDRSTTNLCGITRWVSVCIACGLALHRQKCNRAKQRCESQRTDWIWRQPGKYVLIRTTRVLTTAGGQALGAFYEVGFDGSYFFLYHNSNFNGYISYYNESSGVHL